MNAAQTTLSTDAATLTKLAFNEHFRLVAFVLRSMRVSEQDVEEMAQETFLRYFRHCVGVKPECAKSWLTKTARNVALDSIAKDKRRKTEACQDSVNGAHKGMWCEDDDSETNRAAVSDEAMAKLKDFTRNPRYGILGEYYLKGRSVKSISTERGLRVSSVTSALCRQRTAFAKVAGSLNAH